MADVAAIVTILAFFVGAALLTRPLERVIADTDADALDTGDDAGPERRALDAELRPGRSA
jgi:hypothetical protein